MDDYSTWRLSTPGGIKYKLLEGPTFEYTEKPQLKATCKILLRAQDVGPYMAEMMPQASTTVGFGSIHRRAVMPGSTSLYVRSISAQPLDLGKPGDPLQVDSTAPMGTYAPYYVVTVEYAHGDATEYLEREISYTFEVLELGTGRVTTSAGHGTQDTNTPFDSGTDTQESFVDKDAKIYVVNPIINLSLRYKFVSNPNWTLLWGLAGKVNLTAHPMLLLAPPQTVLFAGWTARKVSLLKDRWTYAEPWNIDLQFQVKRVEYGGLIYGWNHQWVPEKRAFQYVLIGGQTKFGVANLGALFA